MKKVVTYISSCDDCPYCDFGHGFHEDIYFCELLGVDIRSLDKDDNGFPIICPLDDSYPSEVKNEKE